MRYKLRRSDPPPPAGTIINATDPTLFMRPAGTVHIGKSFFLGQNIDTYINKA
jgi:hypothetical protein